MTDKLKLWNPFSSLQEPSFQALEKVWEKRAKTYQASHPLKILKTLPKMEGISQKTKRFLKWKSLIYLIVHDRRKVFPKFFFKHPIKYSFSLLKSYCKKSSFHRDGDFFFYGVHDEQDFKKELSKANSLLVLGFSYCHKPFECPSGRFSDACIHNPQHPVCGQCFIGKAINMLPARSIIPLMIPTIHYIGEKIFEIIEKNPDKAVSFLITACELTLRMFGDWGNMVDVKGIGVRLDGRICNTMQAFKLSEEGIKPGLTVVLDTTQQRILSLLEFMHNFQKNTF